MPEVLTFDEKTAPDNRLYLRQTNRLFTTKKSSQINVENIFTKHEINLTNINILLLRHDPFTKGFLK